MIFGEGGGSVEIPHSKNAIPPLNKTRPPLWKRINDAEISLPFLIGAVLIGSPISSSAQQPACTKRADVVKHLGSQYSEVPVAMGLANNGGVIEVLSSETGGSWTIILTMTNGDSCVIAAGENWEDVPVVFKSNGPDV